MCIRDRIEYARYVENYYGTPRSYVEQKLDEGKDVILEIEIQGALKVKEKFPDTLLLFVAPPSAQELKHRLVGRGTETMEVINSMVSVPRPTRRCFSSCEMCIRDRYNVMNVKKRINRG